MDSHSPPKVVSPVWYAVHTKAREEERALAFLSARDVATYLPRVLVNRRHGSRRWQTLEPLFPGYLFAHVMPDPFLFHRIRWSPGVKKILGNEDAPVPVPEEAVQLLQDKTRATGYIVPDASFRPGARVRFRSGPFVHLEGIIERPVSRGTRVRILLELLGVQARIDVETEELERA
jgi:transcriptional antiterminator RfaH